MQASSHYSADICPYCTFFVLAVRIELKPNTWLRVDGNVRTYSLLGLILFLAWVSSLPMDETGFISNTLELPRDFPEVMSGKE